MLRRTLLIVCASSSLVVEAHAAGFSIEEQDARATGRAGAIVASPDNASTIHYNPAGLVQLRGVQIGVGSSVVAPESAFTSPAGAETATEPSVFVLPQAYISHRTTEWLGLGIGFNAPYGLGLEWPETSPGRAIIRSSELRTFFITPAAAGDLSGLLPGLSFGAGLHLVPASVRQERDILFGSDVAEVALSGTAFGVGARAGLLYRPAHLPWAFGITYASPIDLDFSGSADFDAAPEYRANLPPDGDAATSVTLPQSLTLGVAFRPLPQWELEVDGVWRGWSSFNELAIDLPGGQTSVARRDWRNAWTLRLGTEYTIAQTWSLRLGGIWDQTPIPDHTLDFQLPDANRVDLTAGFGASLTRHVRFDAAALWVLPQTRSPTSRSPEEPVIEGDYRIEAWLVNLTIGVALDAEPAAAPSAGADSLAGLE